MGFCSNCGAQTNDGSAFCMNCGASLLAASSTSSMSSTGSWGQTQQTTGAWSPTPQYQPTYAVQPSSHAIGVLKRVAASPLFLIATILTTLGILLRFISSLTGGNDIVASIVAALYQNGVLSYWDYMEFLDAYGEIYSVMNGINILSTLISLVPIILVAIGLWLTFGAGMSKSRADFSTTGLTMVKVINIINLVFECIGYGIGLILFVVMMIGVSAVSSYASSYSSYYGYGSNYAHTVAGVSIGVIAICAIILIAVAVLRIFWYVKINQSINAATGTARTGNGNMNASTYVGVFCFIGAACGFIGLIFSIFTFTTVLSVITSLCSVAASILFGIVLFTYRSSMARLATTPMPLNMGMGTGGFAPQPNMMNTMNTTTTSETPYVSPMDNTGSFSNWDNTNS